MLNCDVFFRTSSNLKEPDKEELPRSKEALFSQGLSSQSFATSSFQTPEEMCMFLSASEDDITGIDLTGKI